MPNKPSQMLLVEVRLDNLPRSLYVFFNGEVFGNG